jgi:hypothetical protein
MTEGIGGWSGGSHASVSRRRGRYLAYPSLPRDGQRVRPGAVRVHPILTLAASASMASPQSRLSRSRSRIRIASSCDIPARYGRSAVSAS